MLSFETSSADASECTHLELAGGDRVYRIVRVRSHLRRAFMVEEASLPVTLFPDLPKLSLSSHRLDQIAQAYRLLLGEAEERLAVKEASPLATKTLDLAPGAKVLSLERVVRTSDGRPAEWRRAECDLGSMHLLAG